MNVAGIPVGLDRPLFLIAGPCVIESREMANFIESSESLRLTKVAASAT